jgi:hypothetical protein
MTASNSANPTSAPSPGRFRRRFGRSGIALLLLLALVAGVCLHHAIDGPHPWGKEIMKRVADGKDLRAKEYGIIGVWWGCVVSVGICGVLLLFASWWMPGAANAPHRQSSRPPTPGSAFHLFLLIILGSAVFLRAPQLTHSLWNDEEYALRRYFHGEEERQADGRLVFEKLDWDETLFHNFNGNNHQLQSALARFSLETWRFLRGKPEEAFSEVVVRLPSLAAGIFTLVALALVGVEMRRPSIGLGAAALLALHPWHVRYAVEARGYALMLLFMVVAVLALLHALRRDKALSWLCFALAQAGFLLCFAGALHVAVALNALAAWEIIRRREPRRLKTLIGFNLISALPLLIWMLPSVPQLIEFLGREKVLQTPIGASWARDIGSHLATGLLYTNPHPEVHVGTSWMAQEAAPLWTPLLAHGLPVIALAGLFMALLSPPTARLAVWVPLLGGLLAIGQNWLVGQSMLSWYLLYLLLPLCLAVPIACHALLPWAEKTAPAAIVILVALYGLTTQEARARFVQHDRQPIRQAVASYRDEYPEALAVTFGVSDRQMHSYDPRALLMTDAAQLEAAIAEARADKRPCFAVICGPLESLARQPELSRRVRASGDFKLHATRPGLEAMFSYEIWRLTP